MIWSAMNHKLIGGWNSKTNKHEAPQSLASFGLLAPYFTHFITSARDLCISGETFGDSAWLTLGAILTAPPEEHCSGRLDLELINSIWRIASHEIETYDLSRQHSHHSRPLTIKTFNIYVAHFLLFTAINQPCLLTAIPTVSFIASCPRSNLSSISLYQILILLFHFRKWKSLRNEEIFKLRDVRFECFSPFSLPFGNLFYWSCIHFCGSVSVADNSFWWGRWAPLKITRPSFYGHALQEPLVDFHYNRQIWNKF